MKWEERERLRSLQEKKRWLMESLGVFCRVLHQENRSDQLGRCVRLAIVYRNNADVIGLASLVGDDFLHR